MCRPRKWWWGLLPLVLIWLVAVGTRRDSIEVDLAQRGNDQLKADGLLLDGASWASTSVHGRDAKIAGAAAAIAPRIEANATVGRVWGVRRTMDATALLPESKPFAWSASWKDGALVLSGALPPDGSRARLRDAVGKAFPGAPISDQMTLARGAPTTFAVGSAFALSQLAPLRSGDVALSDSAVSISGLAPTPAAYAAVVAALQALPPGLTLARADIRPPTVAPFVWSAAKDSSTIGLSGFAPDEAVRKAIVEAVSAAAPGLSVADQMQIAAGAPQGFGDMAVAAAAQLVRLTNGTVVLTDARYGISGAAPSFETYDATIAATSALPPGFALAAIDIAPPLARPFAWSAVVDGTTVTLDGVIGDTQGRETLARRAAAAFPGAAVVDRTRVARGAAGTFDRAAEFALGQLAMLSAGKVSLSDNQYAIEGRGRDGVTPEAIAAAAQAGLPPGTSLARNAVLATLPTVSPYPWRAVKNADGLVLSGHIPSEASRLKVMSAAAAAMPGGRIVDQMKLAQGLPASIDFEAATAFALAELGRFKTGDVRFSDAALRIEGAALDGPAYKAATGALGGVLPGGLRLQSASISPPTMDPFVFTAMRRPGAVTLSGYVPDETSRETVLDLIRRRFFGDAITDELSIALGAPDAFASAIGAALPQLARLRSGEVSVSGPDVTVRGEALSEAAAEQIRTRISASAVAGMQSRANVTVAAPDERVDAPQCQTLLRDLLDRGRILFETGRATINDESVALLDHLAFAARRCPEAAIDIAGHTDSDGSDEANQTLSETRAAAVRDFLADAGVEAQRLSAQGYGESAPLVPNDTPDNKARNRRIEFSVKQ